MNNLNPKEPLLAVILSTILPGLGQVYASRFWRGIIFLLITVFCSAISLFYVISPNTKLNNYLILALACFSIFAIFIIIDSYICAKRYNIVNNLQRNITAGKKAIIIIGILFFIFVFNPLKVIPLYIRANIVQAFKIPTSSMSPTLMAGDRILVNKTIYTNSAPKRGDVIVFKYPEDMKRSFIQRVVGLPNETIEIKNRQVFINGVAIQNPPIFTKIHYFNNGEYGKEGQAVRIPNDSYYVLGDNSVSSKDSRYWGFVPKGYLLGKAYKIYFPFNRSGAVE